MDASGPAPSLTQHECVVEWDESRNKDLRDLASNGSNKRLSFGAEEEIEDIFQHICGESLQESFIRKRRRTRDKNIARNSKGPLVQKRRTPYTPPTESPGFDDLLKELKTPGASKLVTDKNGSTTEKENQHPGHVNEMTPVDEFGEVEFSSDDFEKIDSIVFAASQHQQETSPKADSVEEDEFGDLPELDIEALDKSMTMEIGSPDFNKVEETLYIPPLHAVVVNPRVPQSTGQLVHTRYKVIKVLDDVTTYTKILFVMTWRKELNHERRGIHHRLRKHDTSQSTNTTSIHDGIIYLRGEWYHTALRSGDAIHLCSLLGDFRTDEMALPLILHTCPPPGSDSDDLVLVVNPEVLLTPTIISEAVSCTRRAVLKHRLGSSGFTSKALLFGTIRHSLFEACMKERDFSPQTATRLLKDITRRNAEGLLACNASSREVEREVIRIIPQLQRFANEYTKIGETKNAGKFALLEGHSHLPPIRFMASNVEGVEEPFVSNVLGLKGNIDMIVRATCGRIDSESCLSEALVALELKTGHNQRTQNAHMAQLALYIILLRERYGSRGVSDCTGASGSGLLLYMNHESFRAVHIAPRLAEIKSLIGQRNVVASDVIRSTEPRGIILAYEMDQISEDGTPHLELVEPPPPVPLPELLPNIEACSRCYSHRECMMYAAGYPDIKSHRDLIRKVAGHLSSDEISYFKKWDRLIDLEADAMVDSIADAWLLDAAQRERETSKSLSFLIVESPDSSSRRFFHEDWYDLIEFRRAPSSGICTPLSHADFEGGCHLVVSTHRQGLESDDDGRSIGTLHAHVARGVLHRITDEAVTLRVNADDCKRILKLTPSSSSRSSTFFRLDRDEVATGIGTLRQNLILFLIGDQWNDGEEVDETLRNRLPRLRRSILLQEAPSFEPSSTNKMFSPDMTDGALTPGCDLMDLALEFVELNNDQKFAVEKVFAASDYSIIQGLPGTGKSSTIVFLARLLVAHGKRVLITSYTHSAVDNILLKLKEKGLAESNSSSISTPVVRVGRQSLCHPDVQPLLATSLATELEQREMASSLGDVHFPSAETLRRVISASKIVGITALSVPRSPLIANEHFDVVIVDEAGQISQPAILGALMAADKFVLVGDHMQLPPLVTSELADRGGFSVSLMKDLAEKHIDSVAQLTIQYRMNQGICDLSNLMVYGGKLKCADDKVKTKQLNINFPSTDRSIGNAIQYRCLRPVVEPNCPVVFINTDMMQTDSCESNAASFSSHERRTLNRTSGGSIVNETEFNVVRTAVRLLLEVGVEASEIGVICPYRVQLRLFADCPEITEWKRSGIELSTIDRYQGRDKDVVIISFVRSNIKMKVGRLLEDIRRLNVAFTRAKCKLIMVGSFATLTGGSPALQPVLELLRVKKNVIDIPANIHFNELLKPCIR